MAAFRKDELRVVLGTSGVYALRMLGLYMALPVMSTWAADLPGATPLLVGMALGAYGLTQALFQVPAGILGDLRGRRVVVALSLLVFAGGSAIVAAATAIHTVILGRLVQGVGAMASTLIALIGDGTREEVRTRAMALMGMVLGVAFACGFVFGPLVAARFGVPWVFGASAALSLAGVALFQPLVPARLVPDTRRGARPRPGAPGSWSWPEARSLLGDPSLAVLDLGIFALHASVTAVFLVVPFMLRDHLPNARLWQVYAPVLAVGLVTMVLAARRADRPAAARVLLSGGAVAVTAGLVVLAAFGRALPGIVAGLMVFVAGFAAIEPLLASLVTRYTGRGARGTAAGLFNMVQFTGAFLGGTLAGLVMPLGRGAPLLLMGVLTLAFALLVGRLRDPSGIVDSPLGTDGLDEAGWPRVHRALVSHSGVLEAHWDGSGALWVRHWPDRIGTAELAGRVRAALAARGARP